MHTRLVNLFELFVFIVVGAVCAAIGDTSINSSCYPTGVGVIPDGRVVSGDFIVGKPVEIERLFDSTTSAYDDGAMSNAVLYAAEAIKRYEASKSVAADKIGFTMPLLKTQMSYFYRVQAEDRFASNETDKAMDSMKTAMALDPNNITNHVVVMCLATALDDYETQSDTRNGFRNSPYAIKFLFFNELVKRGWFLPHNLTNDKFLKQEKMLNITNSLERPTYYTNTILGHMMVRRWIGLDQFRECDFTLLKEYTLKTVELEGLLENMRFARKDCLATGIVEFASTCLTEYDRLPSNYIKEHPALTMMPVRCHLALAEVCMAKKEYAAAMRHVLSAEKASSSANGDVLKTIIWILDEKTDQATRLALKYKRSPVGNSMRTAYFSALIEAGYIADSRYLSDEPFDIRTIYGLEVQIVRPVILRGRLKEGGLIDNGEMIQQWTGLNTERFEPFGPLRQSSWNSKTNQVSDKEATIFCLDTLEVLNPSTNKHDVILVVTPRYEQVFSYIWNDPQKETGWYNFDTQERATNIFVRNENILWYSNPSAKLSRFTLRGAIELKEIRPFPRNINTYKVSNEPMKPLKWRQKRLGDDRLQVSWIKKELNLIPDNVLTPPFRLSISNTVIVVSTNGRPSLAQLRYVDKEQREAKWYSPFSVDPSPILLGDITAFSANIPDPDWLDKVTHTTYSKGRELYWKKTLQILGITKEEFAEEPYVYCVSALVLLLLIIFLNRLVVFYGGQICCFAIKHFKCFLKLFCRRISLVGLVFWIRIKKVSTAIQEKMKPDKTRAHPKRKFVPRWYRCFRYSLKLCLKRYRKLRI